MNFRARFNPESAGFQMAPMIDVVFLLLSFFIATQIFSQWETEINITLPTATTGEAPRRLPGEIMINVSAGGQVSVNQRILTQDKLRELLMSLASLYPGQPVLLRADKLAPYEHIIQVLDQCRTADIWNIAFATIDPE